MPAFIPARLTEAREARGLTQTALADLTGVLAQSISNYENGKQAPREDALKVLAQALNLPEAFFFKPMAEERVDAVFFRSLSSLTKRERDRSRRRLAWLSELLDFLEEYVNLLPPDMPSVGTDKDPATLDDADIETMALECRSYFGLGEGPISNMVLLLENKGIIVTRQALEDHRLDAFSTWVRDGQTPVAVTTSDKGSAVRARFNLAHELGHLILHRGISPDQKNLKLIEIQADRFAPAFLLPAKTFTRDFAYPSLDVFRALKEKWRVSIAAQVRRCKDLEIINAQEYTRFCIYLSRRGWNKHEPLDDVMEPEIPAFLRRCIELIANERIMSRQDIPSAVSFAETDLEDMAGLPRGWFASQPKPASPFPQLKNPSPGGGAKVIPLHPRKAQ